jgi:hypothetical protein
MLLKRECIIALLESQKCDPHSMLDGSQCEHNIQLDNLIHLLEEEPVWWKN